MPLDPITAGLDLAKTVVQTIWPDRSAEEQQKIAGAILLGPGFAAELLKKFIGG